MRVCFVWGRSLFWLVLKGMQQETEHVEGSHSREAFVALGGAAFGLKAVSFVSISSSAQWASLSPRFGPALLASRTQSGLDRPVKHMFYSFVQKGKDF